MKMFLILIFNKYMRKLMIFIIVIYAWYLMRLF
jgi:hypothetical protein